MTLIYCVLSLQVLVSHHFSHVPWGLFYLHVGPFEENSSNFSWNLYWWLLYLGIVERFFFAGSSFLAFYVKQLELTDFSDCFLPLAIFSDKVIWVQKILSHSPVLIFEQLLDQSFVKFPCFDCKSDVSAEKLRYGSVHLLYSYISYQNSHLE